MTVWSYLAGLSAAVSLLAAPANAQEPAEPPVDNPEGNEIIVEGYTKKEIREFLWRSLVKSNGSVAKRPTAICLGIDNVPAALEQPLRKRILANVESFGVEVDEPGCKVNALVVFHEDAHLFVNWLGDKQSRLFRALNPPQKRQLIRPVRAAYNWHLIEPRAGTLDSRAAETIDLNEAAVNSSLEDKKGLRTEPVPPAGSTHSFSVVDLDALDGLTIEQLGDYLTVQMLVVFRQQNLDEVPADSILRLFDDSPVRGNPDAPPEMSRLDRAIISELYAPGRRNFRFGAVRQSIARASVQTLEEEGLMIEER